LSWIGTILAKLGFPNPDEPKVVREAKTAAIDAARFLRSVGYGADASFESLKEVERFMAENCDEGRPSPGGQLEKELGVKLLAIGCYVGDVMRRELDGRWVPSEADPDKFLDLSVHYGNGSIIWPVHRVFKRFQNGEEDSIWAYAYVIARRP
jgi:hypothetical protein